MPFALCPVPHYHRHGRHCRSQTTDYVGSDQSVTRSVPETLSTKPDRNSAYTIDTISVDLAVPPPIELTRPSQTTYEDESSSQRTSSPQIRKRHRRRSSLSPTLIRKSTESSLRSLSRRISRPWCSGKGSSFGKSSRKMTTAPSRTLVLDGLPPGALHSSRDIPNGGSGNYSHLMTSENGYDSDAQPLHTPQLTISRLGVNEKPHEDLAEALPSKVSNPDTNERHIGKENFDGSQAMPIAMANTRNRSTDSVLLSHSQHPPDALSPMPSGTQSEILAAPKEKARAHLRMPSITPQERRPSSGWLANGKRQGFGYSIVTEDNEDGVCDAVNSIATDEGKSGGERCQSSRRCSALQIELEGSMGLSLDFDFLRENEGHEQDQQDRSK